MSFSYLYLEGTGRISVQWRGNEHAGWHVLKLARRRLDGHSVPTTLTNPVTLAVSAEWTPSSPYRQGSLFPSSDWEKRKRQKDVSREDLHMLLMWRGLAGLRPFILAGCVWYFTGRLLMPLVKKTSSQVLPMASRHSSVVMWLGDEALIDFKQTFLWLVGY